MKRTGESPSWNRRDLGSLTERITDGSHNPPKGSDRSEYLMLSSRDIRNEGLNYDNPRYLTAEQFEAEDRRTRVAPGDVLLTIVGTIGKCVVVPADAPRFTLQRSVAVIKPRRELLDPRFLRHSLLAKAPELERQAHGVAQKGLYLDALRRLEILVPPLEEQHRIANLLDEADRLQTLRREANEKAQRILSSLFIERFGDPETNPMGWEVQSLGTLLAEPPKYGAGASATDWRPGTPRYLRITDIDDSGRMLDGTRVGADLSHDELSKYRLADGDVLIARTGATVGKVYLHLPSSEDCTYAGYLIRFRLDHTKMEPLFLFGFTRTQVYRDWIVGRQRPTGQPNINAKEYSSLEVPVPPILKQREYARVAQNALAVIRRQHDVAEGLDAARIVLRDSLFRD